MEEHTAQSTPQEFSLLSTCLGSLLLSKQRQPSSPDVAASVLSPRNCTILLESAIEEELRMDSSCHHRSPGSSSNRHDPHTGKGGRQGLLQAAEEAQFDLAMPPHHLVCYYATLRSCHMPEALLAPFSPSAPLSSIGTTTAATAASDGQFDAATWQGTGVLTPMPMKPFYLDVRKLYHVCISLC